MNPILMTNRAERYRVTIEKGLALGYNMEELVFHTGLARGTLRRYMQILATNQPSDRDGRKKDQSDRDRKILAVHQEGNLTNQGIANMFGISKERVRQILAMMKFKAKVES